MLVFEDLYDAGDFDPFNTDGDRPRKTNRRSERECAYYRDEMSRRSRHCRALGVGREYDLFVAAIRDRLPANATPTVPEGKRLTAPGRGLTKPQSDEGETA